MGGRICDTKCEVYNRNEGTAQCDTTNKTCPNPRLQFNAHHLPTQVGHSQAAQIKKIYPLIHIFTFRPGNLSYTVVAWWRT